MDNLNKRVMSLEIKNNNSNLENKWNDSFIKKIIFLIFLYLGCVLIMYLYNKINIFLISIIPCGLYIIYSLILKIVKNIWMKHNRSGGKK